MRGIDVSSYQGLPEWGKASKNLDFVLLRGTERYGVDKSFEYNFTECKKQGLKIGVYKFSYALTKAESKKEAKELLKALEGKELDLPIFLDLEWDEQKALPPETLYKIIRIFEKTVEKEGYQFGIYCNLDWYQRIIPERVKDRKFWIASIPSADMGNVVESLKPTIPNLACWQYSFNGKVDGIEGRVDMDLWLDEEKQEQPVSTVTAKAVIELAREYIGVSQGSASHKSIVDTYNNHVPLAQNYRLSYSDSWCDCFVSFLFIKLDAVNLIGGTECGVERHVALFKEQGIWNEDGSILPDPGDIIVFDWDSTSQPTNGFSDHIGIVESVEGDIIHTIEGNSGGMVARRTYHKGEACIRGYAQPWYPSDEIFAPPVEESKESIEFIASEVIAGKWGNGLERKRRLEEAGYDYVLVQNEVNRRLNQ